MSTKKDEKIIPPRIMAAYEVTSEVFADGSRIFKPPARDRNETSQLRIKLNPSKSLKSQLTSNFSSRS